MNWLLVFVPVAIALEHWAPGQHLAIFAASGLGVLPLAAWMGRATEQLAERLGGLLGLGPRERHRYNTGRFLSLGQSSGDRGLAAWCPARHSAHLRRGSSWLFGLAGAHKLTMHGP